MSSRGLGLPRKLLAGPEIPYIYSRLIFQLLVLHSLGNGHRQGKKCSLPLPGVRKGQEIGFPGKLPEGAGSGLSKCQMASLCHTQVSICFLGWQSCDCYCGDRRLHAKVLNKIKRTRFLRREDLRIRKISQGSVPEVI